MQQEFEPTRIKVEASLDKLSQEIKVKVTEGLKFTREQFDNLLLKVASGDYSAENILKHLMLAAFSIALTIFVPEVAIAFSALYAMIVVERLFPDRKPYAKALMGLGAGIGAFAIGQHFIEFTLFPTWHLMSGFWDDVKLSVREQIDKAAERKSAKIMAEATETV